MKTADPVDFSRSLHYNVPRKTEYPVPIPAAYSLGHGVRDDGALGASEWEGKRSRFPCLRRKPFKPLRALASGAGAVCLPSGGQAVFNSEFGMRNSE